MKNIAFVVAHLERAMEALVWRWNGGKEEGESRYSEIVMKRFAFDVICDTSQSTK